MEKSLAMPVIRFETKLFKIGSWTILKLPIDASKKLPSRGQTMVRGTINGHAFRTALEPDGRGSHWFELDNNLLKSAHIDAGDSVKLAIEPSKEWPEPKVPQDLKTALMSNPEVQALWKDITPMARWDWIRWIRATMNQDTRKRRIETAFSKLKSGERRPCCFNRTVCTVSEVSKSGMLLEPSPVIG
jgi:hypothetical protein